MKRREYKDIYNVVGAALEVYNTLGRGMAEAIYQEALEKEFQLRNMEASREKELRIYYKNSLLDKTYYADFYYKGIIIELKSVIEVNSDHRSQLFNYMRLTKKDKGVLLNFGEKSLHTERYLYLPEEDDFLLLNQDNYMDYIDD